MKLSVRSSRRPAADTPSAESVGKDGRRGRVGAAVPTVIAIVMILVGWQAYIDLAGVEDFVFPSPTDVASSLSEHRSTILSAAWVTTKEILLGFFIALVTGVVIGVMVHLSAILRRAVYPLLIASQTVPSVVLAPVFVIVLGFGLAPKLAIIWLICFFPVVVNTVDGLQAVDPAYIRMMRTLDATRWAIFRRVEFPSALPLIFTGARIGATYAAIGAVLGEWSGADNGIGYLIQQAAPNLDTPFIIAGVVVLSAITLLLFGAITLAQRVLLPWANER